MVSLKSWIPIPLVTSTMAVLVKLQVVSKPMFPHQ